MEQAIAQEFTPSEQLDDIHRLLGTVLNMFNQHEIPYMAISGTLLGIVRNNDYIPWDDDVDLAVDFSDYDNIMKLDEGLRFHGAYIDNRGLPWKEGQRWWVLKIKNMENPSVFVDLIPFQYVGDEYRMPPKGIIPSGWYDRNILMKDEIHPVKTMKLRDLDVRCPQYPLKFIERSYGQDAVDTCVIGYKHNIISVIKSWLKLGVHGKKFKCDMVKGMKPIIPKSNRAWLWFLLVLVVLVYVYRKYPLWNRYARA